MPKIPADIKEKSPKKLHFLLESTDKSKKSAPLGFRLASFRYLCHAICTVDVVAVLQDANKEMKEELTTAMHSELMEGEATQQEMKYLGICGAIKRGFSKEEALRKYGVSEEEYDTKGMEYLST